MIDYVMKSSDVSPFLFQVSRSMGMGARELAQPVAKWGKYYLGEMPGMFRRSGRGNVKWKGLASSTRANYRARGIQGAQPLFRTGGIMKSIQTETIDAFGVAEQRVYSDYWLAKVHDEGRGFSARTVVPKNKKALRFRSGGKWVYAKKVQIPAFTIPERPILFITAQDQAKAELFIREHITGLVKKGWQNPPSSLRGVA